MIEIQKATLLRGTHKILEDFSLRIADPGVYLILGGSGSGKSLLCDLLAGKIKLKSGKVLIDGIAVTGQMLEGYMEPIFLARAENSFLFDETLYDYASAEMQVGGGDFSLLKECMEKIESEYHAGRNSLMNTLPHGLVLLAQVAIAAYLPCRLALLDGHLTYLDVRLSEMAVNLANDSPFANEKYLILTSGRLSQRLNGISQSYLLQAPTPLTIEEVSHQTEKKQSIDPSTVSIFFAGEWDAAKQLVSGKNFKLLSKLNQGFRLKLTGSIDGMLAEVAAAGIVPCRIEWD